MAHKDPAVRRAYAAQWRAAHRVHIRLTNKAWRESNKESIQRSNDKRPRKTARRVNFWNRM